jgi:hypothetical protein
MSHTPRSRRSTAAAAVTAIASTAAAANTAAAGVAAVAFEDGMPAMAAAASVCGVALCQVNCDLNCMQNAISPGAYEWRTIKELLTRTLKC